MRILATLSLNYTQEGHIEPPLKESSHAIIRNRPPYIKADTTQPESELRLNADNQINLPHLHSPI